MSEHENVAGGPAGHGSPLMVVENAPGNRPLAYKPTEIIDDGAPDLLQKRAMTVATITETWKGAAAIPGANELKESDFGVPTERQSQIMKKKSSNVAGRKRSSISPAAIPMTPLATESKTETLLVATVSATGIKESPIPDVDAIKQELDKASDVESISSEIVELRTPEATKKPPEWPEEEAHGLPRSESRASQVTRAVRQLFCCGVRLEAPSEDNLSSPRSGLYNSGI